MDERRDLYDLACKALRRKYLATALTAIRMHCREYEGPGGRVVHASILRAHGRYDEAEALIHGCLEEIEAMPASGEATRLRGIVLCELGELYEDRADCEGAERLYRQAAELMPRSTGPLILLGAALLRQGKLTEAERTYRRGTQLEGDSDEAFANLGNVLRMQERYEDAADAYREALRIDPDYAFAKRGLDDLRRASELRAEEASREGD